jgi:DevC protein
LVLTKQGFIDFEQNYWKSSTSIGFIFTLGAAMGFVVGCVIVYQVLYTDVSDHLPEYATLMAMGYRLSHLLGVVVVRASIWRRWGTSPPTWPVRGCTGSFVTPPSCPSAWICPGR